MFVSFPLGGTDVLSDVRGSARVTIPPVAPAAAVAPVVTAPETAMLIRRPPWDLERRRASDPDTSVALSEDELSLLAALVDEHTTAEQRTLNQRGLSRRAARAYRRDSR